MAEKEFLKCSLAEKNISQNNRMFAKKINNCSNIKQKKQMGNQVF